MGQLMDVLRLGREAAGLTQQEVAVALGISVGTVSRWERGLARPEPANLFRLAMLYEIDPQALLTLWASEAPVVRRGVSAPRDSTTPTPAQIRAAAELARVLSSVAQGPVDSASEAPAAPPPASEEGTRRARQQRGR